MKKQKFENRGIRKYVYVGNDKNCCFAKQVIQLMYNWRKNPTIGYLQ